MYKFWVPLDLVSLWPREKVLTANNKKSAASRRRSQNKTPANRGSMRPPSFSATIQFSKRFRYQSSTALSNVSITDRDVLGLLAVAQSSTAALAIIGGAKIASVEMWGPPPAAGSTSTVSAEWTASNVVGSPQARVSDTSMGATYCAHVKTAPPKTAYPGMWLFPNGVEVLQLNGPANTIVDMVLTFVLALGSPSTTHPSLSLEPLRATSSNCLWTGRVGCLCRCHIP